MIYRFTLSYIFEILIHDYIIRQDFFFFSSRRRHTRLQGDWSSDVCSSDLLGITLKVEADRSEFEAKRSELESIQRSPPLRGIRQGCAHTLHPTLGEASLPRESASLISSVAGTQPRGRA